ncbi:MAG: prevent-host-death protein [Actinomycetota bacterium]
MSKPVSATDLSRNLADYLNRVTYRGESFAVQRGGRTIAELRPAPRGLKVSDFIAHYETFPHLSPDEIDALAQDIEAARQELNAIPQENPWDF